MISMMKCWDLFLELIRVAIGRQESLTRCPSAVDWEEMYDIACRQTLVAICFSAIERLPIEQQLYCFRKKSEENLLENP